jgi:hypothetical protein
MYTLILNINPFVICMQIITSSTSKTEHHLVTVLTPGPSLKVVFPTDG